MGVLVLKYYTCAMDPMQVLSLRATLAAPKGEWPYTEENVQWSCPN